MHRYNPFPDSKVHGANMGSIWGRQDPGGPHVGPENVAIWVSFSFQWYNTSVMIDCLFNSLFCVM